MKKLLFVTLALVWSTLLYGQAPERFNYQAILRNSDGTVKANTAVTINVSIVQTTTTGTEVFYETHNDSTNSFGLINLIIGSVNTTGITSIDWSAGPYFLKISVDGVELGTIQLVSVPYALYANHVENNDDADADAGNELQVISLQNDTLYLSNGGQVYLGHLLDNTDSQNLMLNGYYLSIEGGNEVTLPSIWEKVGPDITYDSGKVIINSMKGDIELELVDVYGAGGRNLVIGDDTYLSDIDMNNTLGIYGNEDSTIAAIKLGSDGPILTGTDTSLIIDKSVSLNGERITDLSDPTEDQDAATKVYVDLLKTEIELLKNTVRAGGFVEDYDGNKYNIVEIGDQIWMAENLKTTHYSNGDTVTGNYAYNNDENNVDIYGRLYTWAAIMNGAASSNSNPSGVQGVCPTGWHLPSDAEMMELEGYLGMSPSDTNNINWRGTDEGGKMKTTGTDYWLSPNTGATNESGFSLLPGASRWADGNYYYLNNEALLWSCTETGTNGWYRKFSYASSAIHRHYINKSYAYSVRCVMD